MNWITDRRPKRSELEIEFKRGGYVMYGGRFLVTDGNNVWIDAFHMPPREGAGNGYYPGYWECDADQAVVTGWTPLPKAGPFGTKQAELPKVDRSKE